MQREFEGKVVIVSGSSSGIGQGIAIEFARRGAMITLCGRDQHRLRDSLEKCQQAGGGDTGKYISVQGTLRESKVRDDTIQRTIQHFGRLDILITNHANVDHERSCETVTENSFDRIIDTNLKSHFFLIQKAIPYLEVTKGSVLTVSTIATDILITELIFYSMSKAALEYMTKSLALELAPRGIRVNCLKPTLTKTPMGDLASSDIKKVREMGPLHPLFGRESTVEEQVDVAIFLSGPGARFISGQCISVDGAMTHRGFPEL